MSGCLQQIIKRSICNVRFLFFTFFTPLAYSDQGAFLIYIDTKNRIEYGGKNVHIENGMNSGIPGRCCPCYIRKNGKKTKLFACKMFKKSEFATILTICRFWLWWKRNKRSISFIKNCFSKWIHSKSWSKNHEKTTNKRKYLPFCSESRRIFENFPLILLKTIWLKFAHMWKIDLWLYW